MSAIDGLLEQVALVSEGRPKMYKSLLSGVHQYVQEDLKIVTAMGMGKDNEKQQLLRKLMVCLF